MFHPLRLHRQLPLLLLLLPIKFILHRSHVPAILWTLFLHWLFIFIFRPKTESFWNRQLLCPRARSLRSQAPWRLHEDHEKAPTTTATAPGPGLATRLFSGNCAFLQNLYFLTVTLLCGNVAGWVETPGLCCVRTACSALGFRPPPPLPPLLPVLLLLSVSIVVTARCYVRSFCPPLHLPSPRASSLSSTVHHCRPPSLENCHLETSCRESFLSPINLCFRVYSWVFPGILCMTFVLCIDRVLFIF